MDQSAAHRLSTSVVTFLLGVVAFWALRIAYWSSIHEMPFSDMADFEAIAHRILSDFDFGHSEFWRSYKSPTLPVLGAIVFGVFGKGNYLAWQVFQSLAICLGAVWLAVEIRRYSNSRWLGVAFIWSVALAKSSIFWSYKYATEGVAEGLLYLIAANFLWSLRRQSTLGFITTGCLVTASVLNRPNYVVIVGFVALFFLLFHTVTIGGIAQRLALSTRAKWFTAFLLGVALLWSPWVIRGYRLYGTLLLTNTSGGHSLVFDLGAVTLIEPDGTQVTRTNDQLLEEAPKRLSNDYESHLYAQRFFRAWVTEDPARYFRVLMARFEDTSTKHNVYLTTVSRTELFPGILNRILLDKSVPVLCVGILGLIALIAYSSALWIIPFMAVAPWFFAILVANTSRYLDPMLPLYFFGLPVLIMVIARRLPGVTRARAPTYGQQSAATTSS